MSDIDTDQDAAPAEDEAGGPASVSYDQADGLRTMFGNGMPTMFCLASALSADATVTLGLGTANALRLAGHRTLLIDEVPLSDRHKIAGLAYAVRYDIGQVMSNLVSLERAVVPAKDRMWFATAIKLRRAYDTRKARFPSLCHRLAESGMDLDFVLIAGCDPFSTAMPLYGPELNYIVVCSTESASLVKALGLIRELSVQVVGAEIPVLVVGGETQDQGQEAFERLEAAALSVLDQPLQQVGWIASTFVQPPDTEVDPYHYKAKPKDLVLPVSLYQMMANKIASLA